jgi:pimeloyl-ACP methyl ester carboxylesterase
VAEHEAVLPIHSVTSGEGAPVVLIHGAFTTHRDWPPAMTGPVAKLSRVIAVDRPGHGKSPRRRYDSDARAQATQIRDGLGLEQPALLVAHSFGALTALAYAEQYPDEVAAMLLIAPASPNGGWNSFSSGQGRCRSPAPGFPGPQT